MHFAVPTLRERLQVLHFTILGLSEGQIRQILEYKIVKYKTRASPGWLAGAEARLAWASVEAEILGRGDIGYPLQDFIEPVELPNG